MIVFKADHLPAKYRGGLKLAANKVTALFTTDWKAALR